MSKDDFHVIAYRILQYMYDCLKSGNAIDPEMLTAEHLKINELYFAVIMDELVSAGYIKGVHVATAIGSSIGVKTTRDARITMQGIEYLTDNSFMEKVKRFMQETKSELPFL